MTEYGDQISRRPNPLEAATDRAAAELDELARVRTLGYDDENVLDGLARVRNALTVGAVVRSKRQGRSELAEARADVLADPCASYWLKAALRWAADRDPVDALRDAETLVRLLGGRS